MRQHVRPTPEQPAPAGPDIVAARLAHGIRTTLHAVAGHADLLATTELTHDQRRHVTRIRNRITHLLDLVTQVLDRLPVAGVDEPCGGP